VAFVSAGRIVCSGRRLLRVEKGEKGLRQSEAVFQHVKALPEVLKNLLNEVPDALITRVCVSDRPRDTVDSYMPVFHAGKAFAETIASVLGVEVIYTTHQQGHIRAALVDSGMPMGKFVALHLSGGTTQSLLVDESLKCVDIGGTNDLNAGQLVDRIGVLLGLDFPAGAKLEALAVNGKSESLVPTSKNGEECSFSGAENKLKQLLANGLTPEDVAREVYSFLERSIAHLITSACKKTRTNKVLLAGGVASSGLLRKMVNERIQRRHSDIKLYWAKPELSGDNACGVALIGYERARGIEYDDNN
ncbi:MAG: O-sialoglycoprotein endopeptidase, partial [Clostridia bacterium]|nr:O-sialoglycoprotein endopeptidase [Clostridia bacterium]